MEKPDDINDRVVKSSDTPNVKTADEIKDEKTEFMEQDGEKPKEELEVKVYGLEKEFRANLPKVNDIFDEKNTASKARIEEEFEFNFEGFHVSNIELDSPSIKENLKEMVQKDVSSVGKLMEIIALAYHLSSPENVIYELSKKTNDPFGDIYPEGSSSPYAEVRCFRRGSKISFSGGQGGYLQKIYRNEYFDLIDLTDFPKCHFYKVPTTTVAIWLLIDEEYKNPNNISYRLPESGECNVDESLIPLITATLKNRIYRKKEKFIVE